MDLFSFRGDRSKPSARKARTKRRTSLRLETLESRLTPSGTTISGFVYADGNNNGLFEPGETPIANTTITLKNSANQIIGVTTTDSNGFYQFATDNTINTTPKTITQTVNFGPTDTDFDLSSTINQFNPNLGQLTEVDIIHNGSIVSTIEVENTSTSSGAKVNASVSGTLDLIAPGVNDTLNVNNIVGSFTAGKFDGTLDFGGSSGNNFGAKTASGSHTLTLTSGLGAYTGTGQVSIEELASATSSASGGGNVATSIGSDGSANITVVYRYVPSNNLQPGNYTVVETEPPTYTDGLDAINNVPVPGSNASPAAHDTLHLTLTSNNLVNNNFGHLLPSVLSGHVYYDVNKNGLRDAGDTGIPNTTVTLTGTNDLGAVNLTTTTDANGAYSFGNLRPGNYTITETQPTGYNEGTDNLGTLSGNAATQDVFAAIPVTMGVTGQNYDFGELNPANSDLGIVKSANLTSVNINGTLVYTLTVTNYGTFTAQQVQVVDTLPAGVTLLNASGFGWSVTSAGGIITATMPSMAVGATSAITITITVPAIASTITNTATVSSQTPDNNPLNNTSTVTTPVVVPNPPINTLDVNGLPNGPPLLKRGFLTWSLGANAGTGVKAADVAFVDGVYVTLLGTHADNTTLQNDAAALENGTLTPSALVTSVMNTDAYRGIEATNLYESILDRAPTAAEQQAVISALKTGPTTQSLSLSLYSSAEFQSMTLAGANLVGNLYVDITGQLPTATVSTATVSSLATTPISQLVQGLQGTSAAATETIDNVFRAVLRRNPTTAEVSQYLPQIMAGTLNDQSLTAALLTSSAFYSLAAASQH
jgi:uncharacterized repeat protein (TIGR01451 family)